MKYLNSNAVRDIQEATDKIHDTINKIKLKAEVSPRSKTGLSLYALAILKQK
jgi:hypothetical protein